MKVINLVMPRVTDRVKVGQPDMNLTISYEKEFYGMKINMTSQDLSVKHHAAPGSYIDTATHSGRGDYYTIRSAHTEITPVSSQPQINKNPHQDT